MFYKFLDVRINLQAEDGKTEMSLVHFTITNPGWKPSLDSEKYLTGKINNVLSLSSSKQVYTSLEWRVDLDVK